MTRDKKVHDGPDKEPASQNETQPVDHAVESTHEDSPEIVTPEPKVPEPASDDLDIAWLLLLEGIPQIPVATPTATATLPASQTFTFRPYFTATAAPGNSPAPIATP